MHKYTKGTKIHTKMPNKNYNINNIERGSYISTVCIIITCAHV